MLEEREHHFTVGQIARIRNLSSDTVRRLFTNEPGVQESVCNGRSGYPAHVLHPSYYGHILRPK